MKTNLVKIQRRKLDTLNLDQNNVRLHGGENLSAIRESLRKFGQQKPIVIKEDNTIVAGNGTYTAAKSLGWKDILVVVTELNTAEAIAFAIADNRTAELAEWNMTELTEQLGLLKTMDEALVVASGWEGKLGMMIDPIVPTMHIEESANGGYSYNRNEYEALQVKQFVVLYEGKTHAKIIDRLEELKKEHEVDSYARVLLALLGIK